MRLIDADAYSAEMKDRQEAAWKWRNEAIAEEDELKLARAEGAFTALTEAKLTMEKHIINPWHRVEEPPKGNGAFAACCVYDGKIYWFKAIYLDGKWLREMDGVELPVNYWMEIPEPPQEDA